VPELKAAGPGLARCGGQWHFSNDRPERAHLKPSTIDRDFAAISGADECAGLSLKHSSDRNRNDHSKKGTEATQSAAACHELEGGVGRERLSRFEERCDQLQICDSRRT
jgi:hypothetical protein